MTDIKAEPRIVVIDTETTGFGHVARPPREDGVVQIGLAYRGPDDIVRTWSEYCNPGSHFLRPGWAEQALEVNGLSRERILSAPPSDQVARRFRFKLEEIEREVRGPVQLRAYNRDFDQPFLSVEPWTVPPNIWGPCIMIETSRQLDGPDARWVGLKLAMLRLNLNWPGRAHDAAIDSHAALLVLEAILHQKSIAAGSDV